MKKSKFFVLSIFFNIVFVISLCCFIYSNNGRAFIKENFFKIEKTNYHHEQRQTLFKELEIKDTDIVMLGDSLTQRCEWSELFNNTNIKNRGIDGDKTQDVLDRLDCIIKGKPSKIFIMVGINDIFNNVSEKEILNNYEKILDTIKNNSNDSEIYVESILPVRDTKTNNTVDEINSKLKKMCESKDIVFINMHNKYEQSNGFLNEEISEDGTHLKSNGYKIWKESIEKYI